MKGLNLDYLILALEPAEEMGNEDKPYISFEARDCFCSGYDTYTRNVNIMVRDEEGNDITDLYPQIQEYNSWVNQGYRDDFISGLNESHDDLRIPPLPQSI
jgi:hypothetical protein